MTIYDPGFEPLLLDLVMRDRDFVIYYEKEPFLTKDGHEVAHENERLLKHLITDLQLWGSNASARATSFLLFEFMVDLMQRNTAGLLTELTEEADRDPLMRLKTGKPVVREQAGSVGDSVPVDPLLVNFRFWINSSLVSAMNDFVASGMHEMETDDESENPVLTLLSNAFTRSTDADRASVIYLSRHHHSGLVLPMLLVLGRITPAEYAKGVISLKMAGEPHLPLPLQYGSLLNDALAVNDFLACFFVSDKPEDGVRRYIRGGENEVCEFKSTLRWDIRAGKTNAAIERASLKTIAAFLNSAGGALLIGVRDDGSIEGIETDKFINEDKFLLHLWTLIRTCLGRDASPYIRTILEKAEDKTVCMVKCFPSSRPVFLRQPGFNEEFYIRVGPGSTAMDISEALKYIADHFPVK